jgi:hypothetical protein
MYNLTVEELNEVNGGAVCGGACVAFLVIGGVGLGLAIGSRIWP